MHFLSSWHTQCPSISDRVIWCLCYGQDLIGRLLERRPARRLGMLIGRATDVKRHKWFEDFNWEALESRKMEPPRKPNGDSLKRREELEKAEKGNPIPVATDAPAAATHGPESRESDVIFADF